METRVFKFGGASVNSAGGFKNVARIIGRFRGDRIVAVVSAMGKTTNALEELLDHYLTGDSLRLIEVFDRIRQSHMSVLALLIPDNSHPVYGEIQSLFDQLRGYIRKGHLYEKTSKGRDFEYDQIVSYGELFSSCILFHYLSLKRLDAKLFDARELIATDWNYRDARVDWERTGIRVNEAVGQWLSQKTSGCVALTQGFIGSDPELHTTTLGREGSDFTAAILAYTLKTPEVTIWKDVPGVLNADPKWFRHPKKLPLVSYREAIELAYYGASVIHPKTIRPLENAGIRLYVKSFRNPSAPGTLIRNIERWSISFPIYIRKQSQVLISLSPRDFSFIVEENLGHIFGILARHKARANVTQNSAISFSVCIDLDRHSLSELLEELSLNYEVRYNANVELYTIRHYTSQAIRRLSKGKTVLLEQKTRNTVHLVIAL
jgi:aspartate kinase